MEDCGHDHRQAPLSVLLHLQLDLLVSSPAQRLVTLSFAGEVILLNTEVRVDYELQTSSDLTPVWPTDKTLSSAVSLYSSSEIINC